jgi:UDP-galactopyranose mutase
MWTFSKIYNITHPHQLIEKLKKYQDNDPKNLEDCAISLVGKKCYKKLIKGYTEKQWRKSAKELPKEIIERLPVRLTYDNNYFNDKYQGIPIGGYTQIFEKLLDGVDVKLNTDFFKDELPKYKKLIYTGPIDKYFNYQFGPLEYKTVEFEHMRLDLNNHQGAAIMNYTEKKVPKTRTIEHKHFENSNSDVTWVTDEFPVEYNSEINDPYYPVNDKTNNKIYEQYKNLSSNEKNVYFGGRLAEYKYYDMDKVILSALNFVEQF